MSAIHNYCAAKGYGGGWSTQVGPDFFVVGCINFLSKENVQISTLSALHPGCNSPERSQSSDCVAAIHRHCTKKHLPTQAGGLAQEVGPDFFVIGCFETKVKDNASIGVPNTPDVFVKSI
jgi:hypothetical protein